MAEETGSEKAVIGMKDDKCKSIVKTNLKALRKINTDTEFMLLYAILEEHEKRIIQLEKQKLS